MINNHSVAVIGAGSWGTALSIVLANNGFHVDILVRSVEHRDQINVNRTNYKYLSEVILPDNITASTDIEQVVTNKKYVLLVVPSHAMREIVKMIKPYISDEAIIIHATKGIELETYKRMSEVIHEELTFIPQENILVLSGPSHAEEVSRLLPTTVAISGINKEIAEKVQDLFINQSFRVYTNLDVVGVEIAGALKNIIAIGAGLSDGLGFGDNAKAALITRGLAEIARLGIELGANPLTFSGLAGVGDLVVTCTSQHSRNWRTGYRLGKGIKLEQILKEMGMVVEGVKTTKAAYYLADSHQVQMPITMELYEVLFNNKNPRQAVEDLMGRVKTHETEEKILTQLFNQDMKG